MTTPDPHDLIRQAARQLHEAQENILAARESMRQAVQEANTLGLSFTEIADLLDVSRQRVSIIAKGDKP